MTLIAGPTNLCGACIHIRHVPNSDFDVDRDIPDAVTINFCAAFPDGVPDDIYLESFDHRLPYPNDNGIRFELDVEKEVVVDVFDEVVPPTLGTRDVSGSAHEWAQEMVDRRKRRLVLLELLANAPQLLIPTRRNATPAYRQVSDFHTLVVSTAEPLEAGFLDSDDYVGWRPISIEELAAKLPDGAWVYVEDRGPLLSSRDFRTTSFALLRTLTSGGVDKHALMNEFRRAAVYQRSPGAAGEPAFSSLLGLWIHSGEVPWTTRLGQEVLDELADGDRVVLDPGQPHAVQLG